jgi:Short C-terminal domain
VTEPLSSFAGIELFVAPPLVCERQCMGDLSGTEAKEFQLAFDGEVPNCPACNVAVPQGSRFCLQCGQALALAQAAPRLEPRAASVVLGCEPSSWRPLRDGGAVRLAAGVLEVLDAAGRITTTMSATDLSKVARGYQSLVLTTNTTQLKLQFAISADADALRDALRSRKPPRWRPLGPEWAIPARQRSATEQANGGQPPAAPWRVAVPSDAGSSPVGFYPNPAMMTDNVPGATGSNGHEAAELDAETVREHLCDAATPDEAETPADRRIPPDGDARLWISLDERTARLNSRVLDRRATGWEPRTLTALQAEMLATDGTERIHLTVQPDGTIDEQWGEQDDRDLSPVNDATGEQGVDVGGAKKVTLWDRGRPKMPTATDVIVLPLSSDEARDAAYAAMRSLADIKPKSVHHDGGDIVATASGRGLTLGEAIRIQFVELSEGVQVTVSSSSHQLIDYGKRKADVRQIIDALSRCYARHPEILNRGANGANGVLGVDADAYRLINENLAVGEEVPVVIRGRFNQVMVGTNRRVLIFKKGMWTGGLFAKKLTDWDYRNMSGIQLVTGLLTGLVAVQSPGILTDRMNSDRADSSPHAIGLARQHFDEAREGVVRLRELMAKAQRVTKSGDSAASDIPDQIRKLSALRDAGIVSEEEFQSKKQELLLRI